MIQLLPWITFVFVMVGALATSSKKKNTRLDGYFIWGTANMVLATSAIFSQSIPLVGISLVYFLCCLRSIAQEMNS